MTIAGASLACSGLRDPNDSCQNSPSSCGVASSAQSGGGQDAAAGRWACLGQSPALPANLPSTVTYTPQVVDYNSGMPVPGLVACTCARGDVPVGAAAATTACNSPLPSQPPSGGTALGNNCFQAPAQPSFDISIPGGRSDLFIALLVAPHTTDPTQAYVPLSVYFNRAQPTATLLEPQPPIRLLNLGTVLGLAEGYGLTLDTTAGLVVLRAFDCNGAPAPNVYFTIQTNQVDASAASIIPFTYRSQAPQPNELTTDDSGQFGFANVPAVNALATEATAYLRNAPAKLQRGVVPVPDPADTMIGSVSFGVRAGWISVVDLHM